MTETGSSTSSLSASARRIEDLLAARGLGGRVVEMPQSTRSAAEAAAAVGCRVAEIAKSLIFRGKTSGNPYLVIASGENLVDEKRVKARVGEKLRRADADFVRRETGFAIGGIPPAGHVKPLPTFIDQDLMELETIWAAAGTPFAVFRLTPVELVTLTGGEVLALARKA